MQPARTLNMAMVGGGPGAFIGDVHRKAARMDGGIEIVAGNFSRDRKKSEETGRTLLLDPARIYTSSEELAEKERQLPEGQRADLVAIVTPNNSHFLMSTRRALYRNSSNPRGRSSGSCTITPATRW